MQWGEVESVYRGSKALRPEIMQGRTTNLMKAQTEDIIRPTKSVVSSCYGPRIGRDILKYVRSCNVCQKYKTPKACTFGPCNLLRSPINHSRLSGWTSSWCCRMVTETVLYEVCNHVHRQLRKNKPPTSFRKHLQVIRLAASLSPTRIMSMIDDRWPVTGQLWGLCEKMNIHWGALWQRTIHIALDRVRYWINL